MLHWAKVCRITGCLSETFTWESALTLFAECSRQQTFTSPSSSKVHSLDNTHCKYQWEQQKQNFGIFAHTLFQLCSLTVFCLCFQCSISASATIASIMQLSSTLCYCTKLWNSWYVQSRSCCSSLCKSHLMCLFFPLFVIKMRCQLPISQHCAFVQPSAFYTTHSPPRSIPNDASFTCACVCCIKKLKWHSVEGSALPPNDAEFVWLACELERKLHLENLQHSSASQIIHNEQFM